MRAIVVDSPGSESQLRVAEVPEPHVGTGEVRIAVQAAGVNRADLMQRQGLYPPPQGASSILGLECAGVVDAVGPGVTRWQAGDRVMALLAGGGYAERAVAPAGCLMPIPAAWRAVDAAAFPEAFITAYLSLFEVGSAPSGGRILVHGGGSGVGTATISLARQAGLTVYTTAGSPEKCHRCEMHGAEAAINYRAEDFQARVAELTEGQGVDLVLDHIGGDYLEKNLRVLGTEGQLVVIGIMGGRHGQLDLGRLLRKRLQVLGTTLRARPSTQKAAIIERLWARFASPLEALPRPVVDRVVPFAAAEEAHAAMTASRHFGKIVLEL